MSQRPEIERKRERRRKEVHAAVLHSSSSSPSFCSPSFSSPLPISLPPVEVPLLLLVCFCPPSVFLHFKQSTTLHLILFWNNSYFRPTCVQAETTKQVKQVQWTESGGRRGCAQRGRRDEEGKRCTKWRRWNETMLKRGKRRDCYDSSSGNTRAPPRPGTWRLRRVWPLGSTRFGLSWACPLVYCTGSRLEHQTGWQPVRQKEDKPAWGDVWINTVALKPAWPGWVASLARII